MILDVDSDIMLTWFTTYHRQIKAHTSDAKMTATLDYPEYAYVLIV